MLMCSLSLTAQMQVSSGIFTPQELVENVFLASGVEVLNVTYLGAPASIGYFSNADNNIGIESGILLSSGFANVAALPNTSGATTGNTSGSGTDPDLEILVGNSSLFDIAVLEIEFIPYADTLEFRYVFASEEYPEWVCSQFNDVFGFFISGPGISGPFSNNSQNVALVPGTSTYVAINTVNNGNPNNPACVPQHPQFFNLTPANAQPTYDGYTDVFTATAVVQPCQVYKIRLAIADVGDGAYDSGVFLEARSFGTPSVNFQLTTTAQNRNIARGCGNGLGRFSIRNNAPIDVDIPITVIGSAVLGVDYTMEPPSVLIAAGTSETVITFEALPNGQQSEIDSIGLVFQRNPCVDDTIWFFLVPDTLPQVNLGPDFAVCIGSEVMLDGTVDIELPEPKTFENSNSFHIPSPPNSTSPLIPIRSPIDVSGVFPEELGPGMIESVCINIQHLWVDDINVYLIAPSGRFIALTTDNGGDGDHYIETCFSPAATQPIDYGNPFGAPSWAAPFTGYYQPEGRWEDLWSNDVNPVNGTWNLMVIDDAPLPDGELQNWRITFNPEYRLDYNWLPAASVECDTCSATLSTIDEARTYVLELRDSYGCIRMDSVRVDLQPDIVAPTATCATIGYNDLTITWGLQALGENYEISVNGGPWQDPNVGQDGFFAAGLGLDDSVTFVVKAIGPCNETYDTIGCRTNNCIPPQIIVDQVQGPSCFGGADGQFVLQINALIQDYEVTVNGAVTLPGMMSGLSAGTYQIMTVDTLGCMDELMLVLNAPDALELTALMIDSVRCWGEANGALAPGISGGTYPFNFQWADGSTDSLRTNLPGGMYALTLTDANDCLLEVALEVFEFPPLSVSYTVQGPSCMAPNGGHIRLNVSGGAGGFQYNWSQPGLQGDEVDGLSPGIYSVTITDGNGCQEEESFMLGAVATVIVDSVLSTPATCAGGNNGSIRIFVSGGMPPYNFLWSDGGPNVSERFNLTAGMYSITVTDQDGCEIVIDAEVFEPNPIVITGTVTGVTCNGDSDGSITVSASGGAGGIMFAWSNMGTGPTISNLAPGPYMVTATDASGCTQVDTFMVNQPAPLTLDIQIKVVTCFGGSDGAITVSPFGGNGGFAYLWDDPNMTTLNTIGDVPVGIYTVTVTDALGCSAVGSGEITGPPLFTSVMFPDPISCFGGNDGGGTVNPLGGTAPYFYLWSDPMGQTSPQATGLSAGTYFVTITDNRNCTRIDTLVLIEPPALITSIGASNVGCFGVNDGQAQVMASGGTPPYSYLWSTGTTQSTAQNLAPGSYQVTVTDNRGCTSVESVTIQPATEIIVSGSAVNLSCAGANDGSISINVSGGNPPYTYLWNHGSTDQNPQNLSPGIYVVTVTDASNCTRTYNIQVTAPPGMSGNLEKQDIACFGETTGSVTANISGGSPGYAFAWNTGATGVSISSLGPGNYAVTVTDQQGCTIVRSVDVFAPEEPLSAIMVGDTLSCFGDRNGRITFFAEGGTPAYRYSLDGENFNGSNIQIGLSAGTYQGFVKDKNGCEVFVGQALVLQPEQIIVDLGPDVFIDLGEETQLVATVINGVAPYTYSWFAQDSAFLSCLTCPDPIVSGMDFTRTFRVQVTDANGCTSDQIITVHVLKRRIVLVPTAFTPNGDNQNDRMGVIGRPGTIIRNFQIFDRWGEQVFYAEEFLIEDGMNPENSWDGDFRGNPMNSGVFVWTLEAIFPDNERDFLRGQTTLLR